jgi:hypothetical protein
MNYQAEHGHEPDPGQLSAHLAALGLLGPNGKPLSPSNLRRHYLRWRLYNVWATHRSGGTAPSADDVAHDSAARGITGQYHRPLTADHVAAHAHDFERRWRLLTHPDRDNPP